MGTRSTRMSTVAVAAAAGLGLFAAAGSARAQYGPDVFVVTATQVINGQTVHGSLVFNSSQGGVWDDYAHYHWSLQGGAMPITDGAGHTLGMLNSASIQIDADPQVNANFNLTAGALNTTFTVSSTLLAVLPNTYTGQCSGQINISDGDGDGATMSLVNAGGMYQAMYNGPTVFANLFPTALVAAPFNGNSASASFGPAAIPGTVNDMSAQYVFSLTANDTATGTSVFTIVPAPASVGLLGVGGLLAMRRRRGA